MDISNIRRAAVFFRSHSSHISLANAVIADAIHAALEVVSGRWSEVALELDADWRRELTDHLFALNRLYPRYVDLMKAFQAEM